MEQFSIFVHKVVPCVGKRTKPGLVVATTKTSASVALFFYEFISLTKHMNSYNKEGCEFIWVRKVWIRIMKGSYEFIRVEQTDMNSYHVDNEEGMNSYCNHNYRRHTLSTVVLDFFTGFFFVKAPALPLFGGSFPPPAIFSNGPAAAGTSLAAK